MRRKPTQARSQATNEFILEATLDLLREGSYANITTNRIAERAGVNIAALYRYFPNKESIFIRLFETVSTNAANKMRVDMAKWMHINIDQALPHLVKIFLKIFQDNELVLLRLPIEFPQLRNAMAGYEISQLMHGVNRMFYEQHSPELAYEDVEIALFFTANNLLANISHFVLSKPEHISADVFVEELSRSILAYLRSH